METSQKSTSDSRGGGGRDRGSGWGGGRNPWGRGKERSNVQAFTGSAGMVNPSTNIVWSKWLAVVPLYDVRIQEGLPSSNNYHAEIRKENTR